MEIKPNQIEEQQRKQRRRWRLVQASALVSPSGSSFMSSQAHFIKGPRLHSQQRAKESRPYHHNHRRRQEPFPAETLVAAISISITILPIVCHCCNRYITYNTNVRPLSIIHMSIPSTMFPSVIRLRCVSNPLRPWAEA